jgi:hypothetical protein
VTDIYAQDHHYGWNVCNVFFSYDITNHGANIDFEMGQIYYLVKDFFSIGLTGFGVRNLLDIKDKSDAYRLLILPVEIAFLPFNYLDGLFISFYGRAGWQLIPHADTNKFSHGFYGAGGIKILIFTDTGWKHFSLHLSAFMEFDSYGKFKIGVGLNPIGWLVGLFIP